MPFMRRIVAMAAMVTVAASACTSDDRPTSQPVTETTIETSDGSGATGAAPLRNRFGAVTSRLTRSSWAAAPGLAPFRVGFAEHRPSAMIPADPPHRAIADAMAGMAGHHGEEPIAELGSSLGDYRP